MTNTDSVRDLSDAARIFAEEPATRAVAFWDDEFGSTYVWGQATVDNRRSRVLRRIQNLGLDPVDLEIVYRR